MMFLVGLLVVPIAWIMALFLLADGLREVRASRRVVIPFRARTLARGVVSIFGAIWLGLVPWIATDLTEANTGWVDPDGDGMYADMVNGAYDWVDINGGSWGTHVLVLALLIGGGVAGLRAFLADRSIAFHGAGDAVDGLP